MNTNHGASCPMADGPQVMRQRAHGIFAEPWHFTLLCASNPSVLFARPPASPNKKSPFRPSGLEQQSNPVGASHQRCRNFTKFFHGLSPNLCHHLVVHQALLFAGTSRVQVQISGFEKAHQSDKEEELMTIGIHRAPHEFVQEALLVGHPSEVAAMFPKCIRTVIDAAMGKSQEAVAQDRTAELRRWACLAEELRQKEAEFKSSMSERRRNVLQHKKLALFERLLNDAGHQDHNLVQDLCNGFELTGELPKSNVFHNKLRPAKISCENVRSLAQVGREAMLRTVVSSGSNKLDIGLWEVTQKEVKKGFLEGPIDPSTLPEGSLLTKRFPVKQKNKVRPIDDYKANMVNQSVTQTEGVTVHTIDHVASMVAYWLKAGKHLPGRTKISAKCWDLLMPINRFLCRTRHTRKMLFWLSIAQRVALRKCSNNECCPLDQSHQ